MTGTRRTDQDAQEQLRQIGADTIALFSKLKESPKQSPVADDTGSLADALKGSSEMSTSSSVDHETESRPKQNPKPRVIKRSSKG